MDHTALDAHEARTRWMRLSVASANIHQRLAGNAPDGPEMTDAELEAAVEAHMQAREKGSSTMKAQRS